MKVLFLYISTGGGHKKAAEYGRECILEEFPDSEVYVVDALKISSRFIDKMFVSSFHNTIVKRPNFYGKVYTWTENSTNLNSVSEPANRIISRRVLRLINTIHPDAIVCTHPLTVQMLSILKEGNYVKSPVIGIITDFIAHSLWVYKNIDAYIVADRTVKSSLEELGISPYLIYDSGIPVSVKFNHRDTINVLLIRKRLRLNMDSPVLMVLGGSLGLGDIRHTFLEILKSKTKLQILVICGTNNQLRRDIRHLASESRHRVRVIGYTTIIPELMLASDYIVTKPGGLTISEALAAKKPLLLTAPLPGAEERNAKFLLERNAAYRLYPRFTTDMLEKILSDKTIIKSSLNNLELSKPDSSYEMVSLIYQLANKHTHHIKSITSPIQR